LLALSKIPAFDKLRAGFLQNWRELGHPFSFASVAPEPVFDLAILKRREMRQ
jgi:hypothetical protein